MTYIGAGTSGRLGVIQASEIPPTFGVSSEMFIGLIAGGDGALRKSVEGAEDDTALAWKQMNEHAPTASDMVIGLAASGRTPYVIGGLGTAREHGMKTACIVCNPGSPVAGLSDFPVEIDFGRPPAIPGSTRMEPGTAQKQVLDMTSTVAMTELGYVRNGEMWNMPPTNAKLRVRAIGHVETILHVPHDAAERLVDAFGSAMSVDRALEAHGRDIEQTLADAPAPAAGT